MSQEIIDSLYDDTLNKLETVVYNLKHPNVNNQQGLPDYYSNVAEDFGEIKNDIDKFISICNGLSQQWSNNLGYNGGSKKKGRKTRRHSKKH